MLQSVRTRGFVYLGRVEKQVIRITYENDIMVSRVYGCVYVCVCCV